MKAADRGQDTQGASLFRRPIILRWGLCAVFPLLAGCFSVRREWVAESGRRSEQWRVLTSQPVPAADRAITWGEALRLLRTSNLKVRAADMELERAREQRRQVKRSLLPLFQLQGSYQRLLTSGARMDPFSFATDVLLDVPGMVSYTMRRESAELVVVRAELMREAAWREQVTGLYKNFHQAAALSGRERQLSDSLRALPENAPEALRDSLERQRSQVARSREECTEKIGEALGLPGARLSASFAGFPNAGYAKPEDRPKPDQLARLPLRLAAVELVAMRAREMGAKLEDLPQMNVSVSTPRLYQNVSGQGALWSSRDFAAGANVLWTVDTRGQRAGRKRILREEHTLRREALQQEAIRLNNRLQRALRALGESDERLRRAELTLAANPDTTLFTTLLARKREIEEERLEWQVALWFLDDSRWPQLPSL